MELVVLVVPDCPHAGLLDGRLATVLAGRPDVTVTRQVIFTVADAERWGMRGSPTLLIDGVDPFAAPGQPASLACRIYRDADGKTDGAPSVQDLHDALGKVINSQG